MAQDMNEGYRTDPASALLTRARALVPAIAAAAAATERNGRLSPPLLAALHEARLFRMLLPRSVGGLEAEPATFIETLEILAAADASTAWMIAQGCGCSLAAAYLPAASARTVFGPPDAVLAWGPSGTGARITAADGGYRVSGRWWFASGNRHAQWLGGHGTLHEADGSARLDASGKAVERTVVFPRSAASVDGVWNVMGLKGTGSDGYAVEDLFVPAAMTYQRESQSERRETGPLYSFSGMNMFAFGIAAMGLGIARALLDEFVAVARNKADRVTGQRLRDSAVVQAEVARAEARLLSARGFMVATARELYAAAAGGAAFAPEQRARMRLSCAWAASEARTVADFAYTAAGASAIHEAGPFERRFRDLHTLTQQVQAHASNFELVGQSLLGVPTTSRLL
jgi:alkylation response protein AidB-like acyl-CoA dehydrogenase